MKGELLALMLKSFWQTFLGSVAGVFIKKV